MAPACRALAQTLHPCFYERASESIDPGKEKHVGKRRDNPIDRLADMVEGFDKTLVRGLRNKKKSGSSLKRQRRNERQIAELGTQVTALTQAVAALTAHAGQKKPLQTGSE
ncbi:hypothetical protein [Streptomyces sp. NPDC023327]|uniref:hypothetical protein n=1 Tax=Streptomyces sp. NPDC023327 TaxID=3157088 RepID=UPI0034026B07